MVTVWRRHGLLTWLRFRRDGPGLGLLRPGLWLALWGLSDGWPVLVLTTALSLLRLTLSLTLTLTLCLGRCRPARRRRLSLLLTLLLLLSLLL